jgi:hypothetical protein
MTAQTPELRHLQQEWQAKLDARDTLIQRLQDALNTEETGDALVEVARNAHREEQAIAETYKVIAAAKKDIAEAQAELRRLSAEYRERKIS